MRNLSQIACLSVASFLLLLAAGCDSRPALAPVRGKVCFKGTPLSKGTIVFASDGMRGNHAPLASAEIQADGSFSLRTGGAEGAAVGWHRVTVSAVEIPAQTSTSRPFQSPRSLVPEKYRDPDLSGLSCEVKAGKENDFNFNLE